jgi:class 3 adenylate cyclase/HAMP domain-containing protein
MVASERFFRYPRIDAAGAIPYSQGDVKIRSKVILIVLPLIVTPLVLVALASIFTARSGITRVATEFLRFKAEELATYAQSQWTVLEENNLADKPEFIEISRQAIESFARSIIRSQGETILAIDQSGAVAMSTGGPEPSPEEARALAALASRTSEGWQQVRIAGVARVAQAVLLERYGWYVLITVAREDFYKATDQILLQSVLILGASALVSVLLLVLFSGYLTRPLRTVAAAMRGIIGSGDLSRRVALTYRDETGDLGHAFNMMTGELEQAYGTIKGYALESAIAKKREQKIRNIFQKYVPKEVIDMYFRNPESMLVGENRVLAVLFSDIRGFTAISERMKPDEIVESLNAYFGLMVDVVVGRDGIVDKYMGDAIMAFFGAPVRHGDDAMRAVLSAFDMLEALARFNGEQKKRGRPGFKVGIGINYGMVTVGNIGSEKKMDYTVIGDMVNLASRLESLTKVYHEPLLFSASVYRSVGGALPCRRLDRVSVKGKSQSVDLFTARRSLTKAETEAWAAHASGLELFYKRDFEKAADRFAEVRSILPGDEISQVFFDRCRYLLHHPPPVNWNGVVVLKEK